MYWRRNDAQVLALLCAGSCARIRTRTRFRSQRMNDQRKLVSELRHDGSSDAAPKARASE